MWRLWNNVLKQDEVESQERLDRILAWGREAGAKHAACSRRIQDINLGQIVGVPEQCQAYVFPFNAARLPHWSEKTQECPTRAQLHWNNLHKGIPSMEWKSRTTRVSKTVCSRAGMCVCKGRGPTTQRMFTRMRTQMQMLAQDVAFKEKMLAGLLLCHFKGQPLDSPSSSANPSVTSSAASAASASVVEATSQSATSATPTSGGEEVQNLWGHISLQYLRPWNATLCTVLLAPTSETAFRKAPLLEAVSNYKPIDQWFQVEVAEVGGHVEFSTLHEWLAQLDGGLRWHVHFWELSQRQRPCHFRVPMVCAKQAPVPPFELWSGKDEVRKKASKPWWAWAE